MPRPVVVEARESTLVVRRRDVEAVVVDLPSGYEDTEALTPVLSGALEAAGSGKSRRLDVLLHAPLVQLRTLAGLPPVPERDLADLVRNQRTRFFREARGEVVVGAEWADSEAGPVARAALVELELLERLSDVVRRVGGSVQRFVPVDEASTLGPELRTPAARAQQRRRALAGALTAAAVAASGWVVAAAAYVIDLYADDWAIQGELAGLEEPLRSIDELERRVREFTPVAAAYRRQAGESTMLQDLLRIATTLPEDTHLHRLAAQRSAAVVMEAHGPDPLAVVDRLATEWPGVVRIDGAPQADTSAGVDGQERFTVHLEASER